jgi:Mn-dependent DtxR family transcriptional regulator
MAFFKIEDGMRRDHMLMEAILGQLLQSPDPLIGTSNIARRLNVEQPVIRHHLHLLQDRSLVLETESGVWRLTDLGHDYLEGAPQQAVSLNLPSP